MVANPPAMGRKLSARLSSWLAWSAVVLTVVLNGAASGLARPGLAYLPGGLSHATGWFQLTPFFSEAFVVVGALIVWRRPGNLIGWVAVGIGLLTGLEELTLGYFTQNFVPNHGQLPLLPLVKWLTGWIWLPPVSLMLFFLPFLFPDGKPVSPRWWPLAWVAATSVVLGIAGISLGWTPLILVSQFADLTCVALAQVTLVLRYQRAGSEQRQQIKWFAFAALVLAAVAISGTIVSFVVYHNNTVVFNSPFDVLIPLALIGLAASIGISVLRYHLYDIDVFLRRALVYAALVALISLLYLVVVVAIGQSIKLPATADRAVPFVVAAVIALLFQPVRTRLQRLANRLVYGRRATPYEVLANLSRWMAEMPASEDVPRRMARALAEGTEADRAEVWLHVGNELRLAASWPESSHGPAALSLNGAANLNGELPTIPSATVSAPVRYQGEELGVLAVVKREPMTPVEARLVSDLAHEAGLALKNVRLAAELMQRLEELDASRQRLVKAQDTERRRLERNLHDGAQQQLIGLKLKLGMAKSVAGLDPAQVSALLDELMGETSEAIETLRELARGLYPPILVDSGLVAALEAQARRSALPVEISAGPLGRYVPEAEGAVYFCCLEALQNAAKHAQASLATVRLEEREGALRFEVRDDGRGIDPARARSGSGIQNMADRLAALGGSLEVQAGSSCGTTVKGWLPLRPRVESTVAHVDSRPAPAGRLAN